MATVRKCLKCGLDLTDTSAALCPMCGTQLLQTRSRGIWVLAILQFAVATIFMLIFRFPKMLIAVFGVMIMVGTILSSWMKQRPVGIQRTRPRTITHPTMFRVLSIGIALCSIVAFSSVLFGFVIFLNNWNDWHRYEGQSYHATTFQVTHVYFRRIGKGGIDAYASGMVDGNREWMGLRPYLQTVPRSQEELDGLVPIGTEIPIYLFPEMKGRSRVRIYADTPPAEAYHRAAINAVNYGLASLAVCFVLLVFLIRARKLCFVDPANVPSPTIPS